MGIHLDKDACILIDIFHLLHIPLPFQGLKVKKDTKCEKNDMSSNSFQILFIFPLNDTNLLLLDPRSNPGEARSRSGPIRPDSAGFFSHQQYPAAPNR